MSLQEGRCSVWTEEEVVGYWILDFGPTGLQGLRSTRLGLRYGTWEPKPRSAYGNRAFFVSDFVWKRAIGFSIYT